VLVNQIEDAPWPLDGVRGAGGRWGAASCCGATAPATRPKAKLRSRRRSMRLGPMSPGAEPGKGARQVSGLGSLTAAVLGVASKGGAGPTPAAAQPLLDAAASPYEELLAVALRGSGTRVMGRAFGTRHAARQDRR